MQNSFTKNLSILLPVIFTGTFILAVMSINWPIWERSFRSDFSPIAWLSSAQIFAIAFLVLRLTLDRTMNLWLGSWLFSATLTMALDEQFQYHELWKYTCENWFSICRFSVVREAPIIFIGLFGLLTLIVLFKLLTQKFVRLLFSIAISIGIIALSVDQIEYVGFISSFEEGFEVLAEAFFMSGLLAIESRSPTSHY